MAETQTQVRDILTTLGGFVVRCADLERQVEELQQQVSIERQMVRVLREELDALHQAEAPR